MARPFCVPASRSGQRGTEGEDVIAHRIARKIYLDENNNLRGWKGYVLYALYVVLAFVEDLLGLPVRRVKR